MRRARAFFPLLLVLFFGTLRAGGLVEFTSERIEMRVRGNVVTIHGTYHFTNPNPKPVRVTMFYPFPVDSSHPYPHAIRVKPIAYHKVKDGITWTLDALPKTLSTVEVTYSQTCRDRSARYILTTTRAWGRGLRQAEFTVRVPGAFKEVALSYSPDSLKELNGEQVFYLTKKDFLPDKDLMVQWK